MNDNIVCSGALFYATSTKRFLFLQRTDKKTQGMWGLVGGKSKFTESAFEGLKREIEEEVGIIVNNKDIKVNPKIKNVYFYEIEIKNNYSIKEDSKIKLLDKKDSKYKISCLIYGNFENTRDLLSKSKLPYHFIKGEGISHTLLVPIDLAVILMEKIMSYRCNKNHAKGCRLYHGVIK